MVLWVAVFVIISLHVCLELNLAAVCLQFLKQQKQQQPKSSSSATLQRSAPVAAVAVAAGAGSGKAEVEVEACQAFSPTCTKSGGAKYIPAAESPVSFLPECIPSKAADGDCSLPSSCLPVSDSSTSVASLFASQSTASLSTTPSSSTTAGETMASLRLNVQKCRGLDLVGGEVPLVYVRCTSLCRCGEGRVHRLTVDDDQEEVAQFGGSANTALNSKVVMDTGTAAWNQDRPLQVVWKTDPIELDLSRCARKDCGVRFELVHRRKLRAVAAHSACANPFVSIAALLTNARGGSSTNMLRRRKTVCAAGDTILASCTSDVNGLLEGMGHSSSCALVMRYNGDPARTLQLKLQATSIGGGPFH
jgi:hypothetical protein